ncbi:MAG: 50S ribosomal protein L15, partial [Phycisphaeraceae bacterium]
MMIHEITAQAGAHKQRKRIGRGIGSGHGKTAGRGHNGAGSRSGHSIRASREGGQMPFFRRIAKRGFSNAMFTTVYTVVNIK